MRCPSCGAITQQHSMQCPECGAIQDNESLELVEETNIVEEPAPTSARHQPPPARSLIEFPGVKSSIPQWRKDLGERVREVQERRAREAMMEAGQDSGDSEVESKARLLELLPQAEAPPVNPIVLAALQRIERAHIQPRFAGNAAVATMLAYDEQPEFRLGIATATREESLPSTRSERVHNLAVVPRQVATDTPGLVLGSEDTKAEDALAEDFPAVADFPVVATPVVEGAAVSAPAVEETEAPKPIRKPRRLIGDLNDPALNYLDSISVTIVDTPERRSAPVFFRFLSAILDMVVVCLLSSPVVALVRLTDLKWQDSRTIMFASGTFIVMSFLYLTISTAFTGRTLGMKPFSLRVVDARTGLIPTGGQSAARALIYLLSLASAGIALIYFVNPERRAAHDRFTRTAVVRV